MLFHCTRRKKCALFKLALVTALAVAPALSQTANYIAVDNIEEDWVNLNLPAVRPMLIWPGTADLYAVNVHDSTVSHFTTATGLPTSTWRTPWGPVSLAGWTDPFSASEQLLVICRGSYTLAFLDRLTGQTLNIMPLPAEPGDILVDQTTNEAYISCSAQDLVVEVDLVNQTITRQWVLPSKHPLFLTFHPNGDVMVAPMLSGNNSAIDRVPGTFIGLDAQPRGVLDLADATIAAPPGLPDDDLFRINRGTGAVTSHAKGMGTVLFGVAHNPVTNTFWQLGTDANNKDATKQTEPAIKGIFVDNILSIVTDNPTGAPHSGAAVNTINLDDVNRATPALDVDPTRTVGQPYGLHIEPTTGFGFVTGLLTDNVTLLGPGGNFVLEWDLPRGSIPRAVLYDVGLNVAFVYCWGTNKIESYIMTVPPTPWVTFDLGFDPTPELVKKGRQVYYSAFNKSLNSNASCNSCHIEGKADNIAWNLSNEEKDNKGPMFTQLLTGIDRLPPFHWRGERDGLIFFNEAFVLSLRNPANPNANENRVVDDSIQGPRFPTDPNTGNPYPNGTAAATGQGLFIVNNALNCEGCHNYPLATNNESVADDSGNNNPRRQRFKVTPFHEIYRKETDADPLTPGIQTVPVNLVGVGTVNYPVTGFGFSHAGAISNLHHFVQQFENPAIMPPMGGTLPVPLTPKESVDILNFIWQWDNGMGLAVHRAFLLNGTTLPAIAPRLNYLVAQANQRNCDIAVYGTSTISGSTRTLGWTYNRGSGQFDPDDTTLSSQPLSFFTGQASAVNVNVFVGVPVGSGERFGVDFDTDGLFNSDEAAQTTNLYVRDSDNDRFWDGHEVANGGNPALATSVPTDVTPPTIVDARTLWFTSKVATLTVFLDEPSALTVTYQLPGGQAKTVSAPEHRKVHRVVLPDLSPSTAATMTTPAVVNTYSGTIKATDLGGLSATTPIPAPVNPVFSLLGPPPITTRNFVAGINAMVVDSLSWRTVNVNSAAGTLTGTVDLTVKRKTGGPPTAPVQDAVVIFRVLRNGQPISFTGGQGFSVNGTPYLSTSMPFPRAITGPFLVSAVTDANGNASASVSLSGFSPGDVMTLNVEFVSRIDPMAYNPASPDVLGISGWSMPANPSFNFPGDLRGLEITF